MEGYYWIYFDRMWREATEGLRFRMEIRREGMELGKLFRSMGTLRDIVFSVIIVNAKF